MAAHSRPGALAPQVDWLTDKMRERDHTVSATHGDMDQVGGCTWCCVVCVVCWPLAGCRRERWQAQQQAATRCQASCNGHAAHCCRSPTAQHVQCDSHASSPPFACCYCWRCTDDRLLAITSNCVQNTRDVIMREFRSGSSRVLITTDLLARGIDVQQVGRGGTLRACARVAAKMYMLWQLFICCGRQIFICCGRQIFIVCLSLQAALKTAPEPPHTQVSLVINYDLPNNPENYLHRIGRSGRFGRKVSSALGRIWAWQVRGMGGGLGGRAPPPPPARVRRSPATSHAPQVLSPLPFRISAD